MRNLSTLAWWTHTRLIHWKQHTKIKMVYGSLPIPILFIMSHMCPCVISSIQVCYYLREFILNLCCAYTSLDDDAWWNIHGNRRWQSSCDLYINSYYLFCLPACLLIFTKFFVFLYLYIIAVMYTWVVPF